MIGPDETPAPRRAGLALLALGLLFFVVTAGTFSSLGVVLPDMVSSLRWSWTQAGLGFTVLAVVCGLASYAPALVIRTLGVRAVLLLGGAVTAAGFLCLYLVRSEGLYLAGAALAGLGFALTAIIPGAFVLSHLFRRPSAPLGIYFTLGGLGGVAGPWLYFASRMLDQQWRGYWLGLAIATAALSAFAAFSIDPRRLAERPPRGQRRTGTDAPADQDWSVRAALLTPQFWIVVAAYTANLLVEVTVNGLSVAHLGERGVAAAVAGGMLSLQALVGVVARALGGLAGDRIDAKQLVLFALACLAVGVVALASAHGYPLMLAYAAGVGFGYGLNYFASTLLLLRWFGRRRNLELFSTLCLISTAAAAGPVLAGLVRDRTGGFAPVFLLFAGLVGVVLIAVALTPPPRPRSRSAEFTGG